MYPLTQSERGLSSIELGRRLSVTQTSAWKVKHKLTRMMVVRDATKRSTGHVELDDACVGGARSGGKRGRGAPARRRRSVAVETTSEGKPVCLKLRRAGSFCNSIANSTERNLDSAGEVVTDGLACVGAVAGDRCAYQVVKTGSGHLGPHPAFKWARLANKIGGTDLPSDRALNAAVSDWTWTWI